MPAQGVRVAHEIVVLVVAEHAEQSFDLVFSHTGRDGLGFPRFERHGDDLNGTIKLLAEDTSNLDLG